MDHRKYHPFIIIIVVFFIVKLSILFFAIDKLIYVEECYRAFIAKQLIDGPIMPFFDLQWDSYSGGSLVVGLLMVPFFKLLGQNIISVKLVALLFSFASLISLYLFCIKFFNIRVAFIACLLFILSPPLFTKYSLITMGFHTESILFSILLMFIFFNIFFINKKENFHFVSLGFISGFGVWFTYIFSITVFTCLLLWFLLDRKFFLRKQFFIFLISFIIGFSPWIYYNLSYNFSGIHILSKAPSSFFSTEHLIFSLVKLKDLLVHDFRDSLLFDDFMSLSGQDLSTFYYIIFIVSFVVLFWLNKRFLYLMIQRFISVKQFKISNTSIPREIFFLIYIVLFCLIYGLSNFKVTPGKGFNGYRYLYPLYPFVFIIIAIFLNKLREGEIKGKIFFYNFLLIALLSVSLISNLNLISFNKTGIRFFNINYSTSYIYLGLRIGNKYCDNMDKCIRLINQQDEQYRFSLYKGLGFSIGRRYGNNIDRCISLVNLVEEQYKPAVYRGISRGLLWQNDINKCISLINLVEEQYKFSLYRGLGFSIGERFGNDINKCISLINLVEEQYKSSLYRGLGFSIGRRYGNNIDRCISLVNLIEERYRADVYRGISLRLIWKGDIHKCINMINRVEERYKPTFYIGLGKAFISARYNESKYIRLINQIDKIYKPYIYEGFGEGVAESRNWHFEGCVTHLINLMDWMEEEYKIFFYRGLGKGFYWQHIWFFGIDRDEANIDREVQGKYKKYFYEGLENPLGAVFP